MNIGLKYTTQIVVAFPLTSTILERIRIAATIAKTASWLMWHVLTDRKVP